MKSLDGTVPVNWKGRLLDAVGLGRLSRALGIGRVSDRQLLQWACEREQDAKRAYHDALRALHDRDRLAAQQVIVRWPGL